MKKSLFIGMALGLGVFAMSASSAFAGGNTMGGATGIIGTKHDLSASGSGTDYADPEGRICIFCHTPHNAQKAAANGGDARLTYSPLWNHGFTQTIFTPYNNGDGPTSGRNALQADVSNGPGGPSLLCLSCHDGSVAIAAYSSDAGTSTNTDVIAASWTASIGNAGDLTNHHPIGFNYIDVMNNDAEIADTSKVMIGSTTIGDLLYKGTQMECITCHDVHNTQNDPAADKFLWKSNTGSAFCLVCHEKNGVKTNTTAVQ